MPTWDVVKSWAPLYGSSKWILLWLVPSLGKQQRQGKTTEVSLLEGGGSGVVVPLTSRQVKKCWYVSVVHFRRQRASFNPASGEDLCPSQGAMWPSFLNDRMKCRTFLDPTFPIMQHIHAHAHNANRVPQGWSILEANPEVSIILVPSVTTELDFPLMLGLKRFKTLCTYRFFSVG